MIGSEVLNPLVAHIGDVDEAFVVYGLAGDAQLR